MRGCDDARDTACAEAVSQGIFVLPIAYGSTLRQSDFRQEACTG